MYDFQHGFREKRSCETQLIMLVEDLARNAVFFFLKAGWTSLRRSKRLTTLNLYGNKTIECTGLDTCLPWGGGGI